MFEQGYQQLFVTGGIPWRFHYTVVLGLFWVGGLRFVPGAWLGYFVLIIMHELGHGLLALRYGLRVHSINIHGFGGECVHDRARTQRQSSVIAWGGVLMQLVLFAVAMLIEQVVRPQNEFALQFLSIFGRFNLTLAALNLLPLNGLDGGKAWKLFKRP